MPWAEKLGHLILEVYLGVVEADINDIGGRLGVVVGVQSPFDGRHVHGARG